ncbi:Guanylate cyclase [Aphelenchoides bicaudatus]|nr:Guanylate cyclase [Aphelenchoides bicaudatus]
MFVLLFLFLLFQGVTAQIPTLTVGLLFPNNTALDADVGYKTSAGSIMVALNKALKNKIYDPTKYNITFTWNFTQCTESLAVGYASRMIKHQDVSALFGPTCITSAETVGALATFYNIPIFLWSTMNYDFINRKKYPTSVSAAGTVGGLLTATTNVLKQYNWTQIGFLYTAVQMMGNLNMFHFVRTYANTFQNSTATTLINITTYIRFANNDSVAGFRNILNSMNTRARIIIACLESRNDRRNLMLAAALNKMTGPDYLYLFIQTSASGFGTTPFWSGTDPDSLIIREAANWTNTPKKLPMKQSVDKEIVGNIRNWPFYCNDCPTNVNASNLAFYLGDSFYMYLQALNWTYTKYGASQLTNTTAVLERLTVETMPFPSIMGNNFTSLRGFRSGRYALWGLDSNNVPTTWGISFTNANDTGSAFTANYQQEENSIWSNRGGKRPPSVPICGFNNICPLSPLFYVSVVVASLFLFFSIIVGLGVLICIFQRQQRRRLNALWQTSFYLSAKTRREQKQREISQSSSNSKNTLKKETEHTEYFLYDNDLVVAHKLAYHGRWSSADEEEFRKMRKVENSKLNRFLGVSVSGPNFYVLWNYCDRGNIIEVIATHESKIDFYIMVGMLREICEGLHYIHNSSFVQHGNLNAYCCVVGDRFDVKIQNYGLSGIKSRAIRRQNSKCGLYVAPEHLQGRQSKIGSQAGDIYSFAIIASVILTMKPAFGIEDVNAIDVIEDTIHAVTAGRYPPTRPSLQSEHAVDIHPELLTLIRDCWNELPAERPKIDDIREMLYKRSGGTSKSTNLMDHMFALMENSAAELEQDVKMRTLELQNEQKKADILLYRIMPRSSEYVKLGQTVTPEVFESCTVFFSDIVSFTVLASKSTPLQIINFLNDVYTLADSVIDKYDCYKVETIGDGMHVVSGVPKRNGHTHVKAILDMAIDFQRSVKTSTYIPPAK